MDLDAGSYIDTSRQTVANYLDEWQRAKRAGLKPTTAAAYADSIRAHVVPRIGGVPLQKVDGALLDSFYADLLDHGRRDGLGGLSAKTVRNLHGILNKAFRDAVRWRRLARNPAEAASPPAKRSPETLIWSPEQLRTFLEQVREDRHYALWLLAATTGLRRGELAGLRWCDIDLDRRQIRVVESRVIAKHQQVTGLPKSERSRRTINVDAATLMALRLWRKCQAEEHLVMGRGLAGEPAGVHRAHRRAGPPAADD